MLCCVGCVVVLCLGWDLVFLGLYWIVKRGGKKEEKKKKREIGKGKKY